MERSVDSPHCLRAEMGSDVKFRLNDVQNALSTVHEVSIGQGQLESSVESKLIGMKPGEIVVFNLSIHGVSSKFQIHLISASQPNQLADSNKTYAQSMKIQGNTKIKEKIFPEAINLYRKGYSAIEYDPNPELKELRLALLSNNAQACLNGGDFQSCLAVCQKYNNEAAEPSRKVLYRQACALKHLHKWQESLQCVEHGLSTSGSDESALKDFKILKDELWKCQKQEAQKEKRIYGQMFG